MGSFVRLSRSQHERLERLWGTLTLLEGARVKAEALSARHGVSTSTIYRDLTFLRDLGVMLGRDDEYNFYVSHEGVRAFVCGLLSQFQLEGLVEVVRGWAVRGRRLTLDRNRVERPAKQPSPQGSLNLETLERQALEQAIREARTIKKVAELLGISRQSVLRRIEKHNLNPHWRR